MVRTALVVEDEKALGEILAEHLRRWGFEPTVLNVGQPAIPWVRRNRPSLVLLDLLLPDADGFTICEEIKLDPTTNLIPIVMLTCLSGQEEQVRGLKVGANRYLTKPFTATGLRRAIDEAIEWQEDLKRRGTEGEIRFHFPSDNQYLEELNHLLASLFRFSGFDAKQVKQLTTVVRELGANAIEWGHQKQLERVVTVDYHIDPEKVTIVIKDTGPGFNPTQLPHASSGEDPIAHMMVRESLGLREGGFGILLARGLVDDLTYNEAGNEVRLVKKFPIDAHIRKARELEEVGG